MELQELHHVNCAKNWNISICCLYQGTSVGTYGGCLLSITCCLTHQTISTTDEAWTQFYLERGGWHRLPCLQSRWFSKPKFLVNIFPHFRHMLHNLVLSQILKPSKWFATFLVIHTPNSYEAQDYNPEKCFPQSLQKEDTLIIFHSAQ